MGVLEEILDRKQHELPELRRRKLPAPPSRRPVELGRPRGPGPASAAEDARLRLICEIKRRSPSAGQLSTRLSVTERARAYQSAGASMLSVLCDQWFFDGEYTHLSEARAVTSLPLLCKEFVIDESQLDCARAFGADAVLLIVRCVPARRVAELIDAAKQRELVPFVEVATEDELSLALSAGAELIGVNARDLDTLEMDPERAASVLAQIPDSVVRVHLSGLATPADVLRIRASGADAALVGEALMRADDPEPLLRALARAAREQPAEA